MRIHRFLQLIGLLLFLSGGITWAQESMGTISGTVEDRSGAVLPGVKISILNEDTGISRTVESDSNGHYTALSLSLGNYRVTATRSGFETEVRSGIVLTVGREAVVNLSLTVGSVTQEVKVTSEAPLVELTTASLDSLVTAETTRSLPLNGRSWDQLSELQPGVVAAAPGVLGGTPFSGGSGERFSVGGQRPSSGLFLLDGTDINDQGNSTPGGAAGLNLGVDAIREFQIYTSSFQAEFGRATGSIITAVTRSGTNFLHGTAFEYIRNSALDTKNYFDTTASAPPFRRNQFGGVLGGPIKKDKAFFFGGYEGLRQGQDNTQIAIVPTALTRQGILPTSVGSTTTVTIPVNPNVVPFLNLYPLPNGPGFGDGTAEYLYAPEAITNEDNAMGRVDYQLNEKTSIFGRYTFDRDSVDAPLTLPTLFELSASRRQYTTLQANSVLGPSTLNNFRFAYNRTASAYQQLMIPDPGPAYDFVPGLPIGLLQTGAIGGAGGKAIQAMGPNAGSGISQWAYNIFEWGDDFSYIKGKHAFKTGVNIERMEDNTAVGSDERGVYTFTTLNTFIEGIPSNFQSLAPFGTIPLLGLRQSIIGVYGQDDYTVNPRLTLNLGLRWEISTDPVSANGHMAVLPSPSATSTVISNNFFSVGKKNFGPRFGLAWQLDGSGKTVLRVGGGAYYNLIMPEIYEFQTSIPPFTARLSITNPAFPRISQSGTVPLSAAGNGTLALVVMAPYDKTPVSYQYNMSFQREIFKSTVVQIAYAGNRSNQLESQREGDTATPVFCSSTPNSCPTLLPGQPPVYYPAGDTRQNPAWNGIRWNSMTGTSEYNSGTVTLRRQISSGLQGQIFYTFSRVDDLGSSVETFESTRSPQALLDPYNPRLDWGLADFSATNNVVANFIYLVPFRARSKALAAAVNGWTLDGIGTFQTGMPLTARLASSVSRDLSTQFSERPNLSPGFSNNPTKGTSAGCNGFLAGTPVRTAKNWYNPCAFSLPQAGTYGNMGRNTIIGPGVERVDLALHKDFPLHETKDIEFRAESFNTLNHTNLGLPSGTALASSGAANPAAGLVTYTATSSRQLQFALRINF